MQVIALALTSIASLFVDELINFFLSHLIVVVISESVFTRN
jgi:hypothetical protein